MFLITQGYLGPFVPTQGYTPAQIQAAACIVPVTVSSSILAALSVSSSLIETLSVGCPMIETTLKIPKGQARTWQVSYSTPTNITGASYIFTARDLYGTILFQCSTGAGTITITDVVNGKMNINVTNAVSIQLIAQEGTWDLWRTDSGNEDQIGVGDLIITPSVKDN